MRISYRYFSLICLIVLSLAPCDTKGDSGFYEKSRQGFYWYERNLSSQNEEAFKQPEADAFTYNDLWMLNPDRFKIVLKNRFDLAIQAPTNENVYRYTEIQDVAKRKSMAFAGVMGFVSQQNPHFQGKGITTMTHAGRKAYYRLKSEQRDKVIGNGRDKFALIVFESLGCGYCEAQRPILEAFQEREGWTIKYLDIHEKENLATKYNIDMTPTIMMLSRNSKEVIHISKGVISMAELKNRIARAIRYINGETKAEQWFNGPGSLDPLKLIHQGRGQQ